MKVNNITEKKAHNQWTSGSLNPDHYQDYATYFVKWIKAFNDNGINIYSVTPQNEPLNRGNSASCYMPWEEERDFVKTALGPAFAAAGINTKIYAFDHNYNYDNIASQQQYPVKIYADEEAKNYLAGAAYHNYGGNKDELTAIHNAAPVWTSFSLRPLSAHGTMAAISVHVFLRICARLLSAPSTAGPKV